MAYMGGIGGVYFRNSLYELGIFSLFLFSKSEIKSSCAGGKNVDFIHGSSMLFMISISFSMHVLLSSNLKQNLIH